MTATPADLAALRGRIAECPWDWTARSILHDLLLDEGLELYAAGQAVILADPAALLHGFLDDRPDWWDCRLALADVLTGAEAEYQRWAVRERKHPLHRLRPGAGILFGGAFRGGCWDWWRPDDGEPDHSAVSEEVYEMLWMANPSTHGRYPTRREAEDDLARVLLARGELPGTRPAGIGQL